MKILIIGASSYVGARLYLDVKQNHEVLGTYSSNKLTESFVRLDIADNDAVHKLVEEFRPEIIVHCANLPKNEPIAKDKVRGKKVNLDGTGHLVNAANKVNSKFVFISSIVALSPFDLYGQYKKMSEDKIKSVKSGWLILQPPYILGLSPNRTNDRPFNRILKNIIEKTEPAYDTSWKTSLSYLGHISELIEACIAKNIWNKSIPLGTAEKRNRYEMARDILKPFDIKAIPTDKKDTTGSVDNDLKELNRLGLKNYTYDEIIKKIVWELKNMDKFLL